MIIDLLASLLFIAVGFMIGINYHTMRKPKPRHATKNPHKFLYGKHKMEWFWRREHDDSPAARRLPLREYAKLRSGS